MNNTQVTRVLIDSLRINSVCEAYFKWKDLNTYIKTESTRGINMPDVISEPMGCYCLGYLWNRGDIPGDATDPLTNRKIEFKATSSFCEDLSSFGPKCDFDTLVFLNFDIKDNLLYIYELDINSETLKDIKVSKRETLGAQQSKGKRPRFSIFKTLIMPYDIKPNIIFDIRRMKIIENNLNKF